MLQVKHKCVQLFTYTYQRLSTFRVDLNLSIKVGDFGFTGVTSYQALNHHKSAVKWMAPETLQDGISTEKTNVVRCRTGHCSY